MIVGVFYIISYVLFLLTLILVKKSDKKANLFTEIALSVMATFCYQAAMGALFYRLSLPISNLTVGIADLLAGIVLLIFLIKKGRQQFSYDKKDVVAFLISGMVAGYYMRRKFGYAQVLGFISIDSTVHMNFAKTIAVQHIVPTNMFFAAINTAMPMEVVRPIIGDFELFRVFVLWETGYLFLSGFMFYQLIKEYMNSKGTAVLGMISIPLYMTAYPLYSYLFGFSYFGISIPLIAYILYLAKLLIADDRNKVLLIVMLNLGLFGLFVCYMMFVPMVFVAVLAAIIFGYVKSEKLFTKKHIAEVLGVFLLPSVFGLLFTFGNLLNLAPIAGGGSSSGAATATGGIAADGGCYNDMYSNFVLLAPFIISGMYLAIRDMKLRKRVDESTAQSSVILMTLISFIIFVVFLFIMAMQGKVSIYYYVKNNNVLFLLGMVFAFRVVAEVYSRYKYLVISGFAVLLFALGMILFNVDEKILDKNERFLRVGFEQFLDIYSFNHEFVRYADPLNYSDIETFRYMDKNVPVQESGDPEIMLVGTENYTSWFTVLTKHKKVVYINSFDTFQSYDLSGIKYICVQKTDIYKTDKKLFDELGTQVLNNKRDILIEME